MHPVRLESAALLSSAAGLEPVLGPVASVERSPLETIGFSNSSHAHLRVTLRSGEARALVLKVTPLAGDWLARRSGDALGREAQLLDEPSLSATWRAFDCPYLAYAADGGEVGLLMEDLTPWLAPDAREPLEPAREAALLDAIVELHAAFWDSTALALPWLMPAWRYCDLLCPAVTDGGGPVAPLPAQLAERVARGWDAALARVPARVKARLLRPARALTAEWAGLPRTLVHGDVKVANFGFLPAGRVSAFDWSLVGAGPPTLDLGWYLAVNATRLTCGKDEFLARYRAKLEARRGAALDDRAWARLVDVGVACGALSLLWSKGAALDLGGEGARREWDWWVARLEAWCDAGEG